MHTGKPCKSNVNTSVFDCFANWMYDHGNQQHIFKQYIKTFAKLMTNLCNIDARNTDAKKNTENDANMEPKWGSESIKNT